MVSDTRRFAWSGGSTQSPSARRASGELVEVSGADLGLAKPAQEREEQLAVEQAALLVPRPSLGLTEGVAVSWASSACQIHCLAQWSSVEDEVSA